MPTRPDARASSRDAGGEIFTWLRMHMSTRGVDVVLWTAATIGAFVLRYDGRIPSFTILFAGVLFLGALKGVMAILLGLHRQSWRKFSFLDTRLVTIAVGSASIVATLALFALPNSSFAVTIPAIDGLLSLVFMLGARGVVRYLDEGRARKAQSAKKSQRVLIIGAGDAGAILAREMLRHPETGMQPIGFLDDDPLKLGRSIASVPVLGTIGDLESVLGQGTVDEVLICIPSVDGRSIRRIVDKVQEVAPDISCRTMPALHEVLSGKVQINRIRNVTIDDLLRRPTVELDAPGVFGYLKDKRVMVTGAGGSIGSELVRQICSFQPAELILFGHGENSIYQLERELDVDWPGISYTSVIAQVQNVVRLENVFQRYQPEVIFHTAAHKHVPLMELNPEEAVFNNIVGSRNLVDLSVKYGVTHFVNISTDKAVNPTSVMGATKRIVEMLVEAASRRTSNGKTFVSVRFGNVLGSRGSAVPIFKRQIARGGPVTVTHPDMVRYFMTIPEAARLVLQASAQGRNGEIYILDMGEPVKVVDLVTDLIRLSGLRPDIDIPIVFTGKRPGEKLYEELMTELEETERTEHEKIFVAQSQSVNERSLARTINGLVDAALKSDGDTIRTLLGQHIEGAKLQGRSAGHADDRDVKEPTLVE